MRAPRAPRPARAPNARLEGVGLLGLRLVHALALQELAAADAAVAHGRLELRARARGAAASAAVGGRMRMQPRPTPTKAAHVQHADQRPCAPNKHTRTMSTLSSIKKYDSTKERPASAGDSAGVAAGAMRAVKRRMILSLFISLCMSWGRRRGGVGGALAAGCKAHAQRAERRARTFLGGLGTSATQFWRLSSRLP